MVLTQAKVVYNRYGCHDPQGRLLVLKDDIERYATIENYIKNIESGYTKAEPMVIRANAGDYIELRITNLLQECKTLHFEYLMESAIPIRELEETFENETVVIRFYANKEPHTILFRDPLVENKLTHTGVIGALIIEVAGSSFFDPYTGENLNNGTNVIIQREDGTRYREFTLFLNNNPTSKDDVIGLNYRSEPMVERLGPEDDAAYVFCSYTHDDPSTPILETYAGDPMTIMLFNVANKEAYPFHIAGMVWKERNKASNIIEIEGYYQSGDYLYYLGGTEGIWLGLWGIIRSYGDSKHALLPLYQDKHQPYSSPFVPPADAIIRKYEIAAIQKDIIYNYEGDHDPNGLLFVPLDEVDDILINKKKTRPLILRANMGDWIEITLHNLFESTYPSSSRVSINPQFLKYDILSSYGINVGLNSTEQTVMPGDSKKYLWHADKEYGICMINSFGDLRNQKCHGLFGAIIIEPPAAKYKSASSDKADNFGEQVIISEISNKSFKEFVLFIQNGITMFNRDEVTGYNYRCDRANTSRLSTPMFKAYLGEQVKFRVISTDDKPMNLSFTLKKDIHSQAIEESMLNNSVYEYMSDGNSLNIDIDYEATQYLGEYFYSSGSSNRDVESSIYGLFKIAYRNTHYNIQDKMGITSTRKDWWQKKWWEK